MVTVKEDFRIVLNKAVLDVTVVVIEVENIQNLKISILGCKLTDIIVEKGKVMFLIIIEKHDIHEEVNVKVEDLEENVSNTVVYVVPTEIVKILEGN